MVFKQQSHTNEAVEQLQSALRLNPDFTPASNQLNILTAKVPGP